MLSEPARQLAGECNVALAYFSEIFYSYLLKDFYYLKFCFFPFFLTQKRGVRGEFFEPKLYISKNV